MLERVLRSHKIGNKSQIFYLTELLLKGSFLIQDLKAICISSDHSFSQSFEGMISLLEWLEIITIEGDMVANNLDIKNDEFIEQICGLLFEKLMEENELHNFINCKSVIFDEQIYILNSHIKLHFSAVRNFLVSAGLFMKDNLVVNQFLVNPKFQDWFITVVVPYIEESQLNDNNLERLLNRQAKQAESGKKAEEFVLAYEKSLRSGHANSQNIKIISEMDVEAGYDILSYQADESKILDKHIEVKSYSREKRFFWSRNEMKVAQEKRDGYFLYLVNRDEMHLETYKPDIIQNPYQNVKESENWVSNCESWEFTVSSKGEGHR